MKDKLFELEGIEKSLLNNYSPVPLYYQISLILEKCIISNDYSSYNCYLPSEEVLSKYFGVSRPTINRAVNELVKKSYIHTDNKNRRRYIKKKQDINLLFLNELSSFGKELNLYKINHSTKVLAAEEIIGSEKICSILGIPKGSKIYFLKRLRFVNNEPIILVESFLVKKYLAGLLRFNFTKRDLYEILLDEYGIVIKEGRRKVKAIKASSEESGYFHISIGEPILSLESEVITENKIKIEYFESKLNAEKVALIATVYPPKNI